MKLFMALVEKDGLEGEVRRIKDVIKNERLFILETPEQYALTFSIPYNQRVENCWVINRNKPTNTIFTINALNYLIKRVNGGIVDETIRIQWEAYRNSILLIKDGYLQELPTKVYSIE